MLSFTVGKRKLSTVGRTHKKREGVKRLSPEEKKGSNSSNDGNPSNSKREKVKTPRLIRQPFLKAPTEGERKTPNKMRKQIMSKKGEARTKKRYRGMPERVRPNDEKQEKSAIRKGSQNDPEHEQSQGI